MSIYKVDTESIIALSRLLHVGGSLLHPRSERSYSSAAQMCSQQRSVWPTRSAA